MRFQPQASGPLGSVLEHLVITWLVFTVLIGPVAIAQSTDLASCNDALGMGSLEIPDDAITASSSYMMDSLGPANARLNQERGGGAWCPESQISPSSEEYLQIDLGELKVITKVATQGRFGNGMGREYPEFFRLEFQLNDQGPWERYRNQSSNEVFEGNTNMYVVVSRDLTPPIIARKIRFYPVSDTPKTVCMRVEVYGCTLSRDVCQGELGMEDSQIPDENITASSSFDASSVGPAMARLHQEYGGGAWCPLYPITDTAQEYLQIDLGGLKVITKVATQGRFGNGRGREYAESYALDYQAGDEDTWTRYEEVDSNEVLEGNTNTYLVVTRDLSPVIIASRIRFVPVSDTPMTVCMRVEIYGCG